MSDAILGRATSNSGHKIEASQRFLEAKQRYPAAGSEDWAQATALAFEMLMQEEDCSEAKPEWWNDEGLKALSARVVRAAPNDLTANLMRADVLCGHGGRWELGPRSAAELMEAAAHYHWAAALNPAPLSKAAFARFADDCRSRAGAM